MVPIGYSLDHLIQKIRTRVHQVSQCINLHCFLYVIERILKLALQVLKPNVALQLIMRSLHSSNKFSLIFSLAASKASLCKTDNETAVA